MKSKAHIKSHPLHPILIVFPIAFYIGTFMFDLLALFSGNPDFVRFASYLQIAAIGTAVIAAIPGVVDFLFTVPPKSSAKERAIKHAVLNVTTLLLFIIAYIVRDGSEVSILVIGLEALGVVLLGFAGWMGGTLVHRNQIGIDIRYAEAGKWAEIRISGTGLMEVAKANELKTGQMKLIHLENKRIVLGKSEKGHFAFDDRCTHKGGSLAGGALICGTVQCPWHGSQFDIETGNVKAGPGKEKINTYTVIEEGGKIFIQPAESPVKNSSADK